MEILTNTKDQVNNLRLLQTEDFPLKKLNDFCQFHGFYQLTRELEENKSLFKFDLLSYLNALLWTLSEISKSKEQWYSLSHIIKKDDHDFITKTYGSVFYFHFVWLIKIHSMDAGEKVDAEEFKKMFKDSTSQLMNILSKLGKTEVIQSEYIVPFTITSYHPTTFPSHIESWLLDEDRSYINHPIYYYLYDKGKSDEEMVCFFKTLYYLLGLLNYEVLSYPNFTSAILSRRLNLDPSYSDNESKDLLYWILIALRDKIGFEESLKKNPDFGTEMKKLYSFFNGKAKLLKCSPDQDHEEKYYYYPNKEIFDTLNSLPESSGITGFEDFLKPEGLKLLPYLKNIYATGKKNRFAYMLFALKDLGVISQDFMIKQTKCFLALKNTFGHHIGTRSNLNNYLLKLNSADKLDQSEIENHVRKILEGSKS